MKRALFPLLPVVLGAVFLFSAYSKLVTVEFFELAVVDSGIIGWGLAPVVARLIIGVEFFTGLLLLLNIRLRRFTLPLAFGLLIGFTVYLFIRMLSGQQENCQCFGELLPLNPGTSILKNLVLLAVAGVIYRFYAGIEWRRSFLILTAAGVIALVIPFTDIALREDGEPAGSEMTGKILELDRVYSNPKAIPPATDLRSGRHIIAFLSLKCPYCIMTAYKLRLMKEKNPSLPVWLIVNGKTRDIPKFLEETGAYYLPQTLLVGEDFKVLTNHKVPLIFFVQDSRVIKALDPLHLSQKAAEDWLSSGDLILESK